MCDSITLVVGSKSQVKAAIRVIADAPGDLVFTSRLDHHLIERLKGFESEHVTIATCDPSITAQYITELCIMFDCIASVIPAQSLVEPSDLFKAIERKRPPQASTPLQFGGRQFSLAWFDECKDK